ncbi:hypothetical protein QTP88_013045 [Uroleucon formosanum]
MKKEKNALIVRISPVIKLGLEIGLYIITLADEPSPRESAADDNDDDEAYKKVIIIIKRAYAPNETRVKTNRHNHHNHHHHHHYSSSLRSLQSLCTVCRCYRATVVEFLYTYGE